MSRSGRAGLAALVLLVTCSVLGSGPATAQDTGPTIDTSVVDVPTQDIVPEPNSGQEPSEAGDRGGALQLGLLALVVAAIGGVVWHLVRQARAAREA